MELETTPTGMPPIMVTDYSIALGLDEHDQPVCLFLHAESLPESTIAMSADRAEMRGDDLHLQASSGVLALKGLDPAMRAEFERGLAIVVLDAGTGHGRDNVILPHDPDAETLAE